MQEYIPLAITFAKNHSLMVLVWVLLFVVTIYTFFKDLTSKVKVVDNNETISLINNENAVIIDLRPMEEFERGHIVNSLNILPTEIKEHNVGKIENHKDKPVVVVDQTGINAEKSADLLVKQGFNHVYTLKEGIAGWNVANLPLVNKRKK